MSVLIPLLQGEDFLACLCSAGVLFPSSADILRESRPQVCNAAVNFYDSTATDVLYLNSFSNATILINSIQGLFTLLPKCFLIWHYRVEC